MARFALPTPEQVKSMDLRQIQKAFEQVIRAFKAIEKELRRLENEKQDK